MRTQLGLLFSSRSTSVLSWPRAPSFRLKFPLFSLIFESECCLLKLDLPNSLAPFFFHLFHSFSHLFPFLSSPLSPPYKWLSLTLSRHCCSNTACRDVLRFPWYESVFSVSGKLTRPLNLKGEGAGKLGKVKVTASWLRTLSNFKLLLVLLAENASVALDQCCFCLKSMCVLPLHWLSLYCTIWACVQACNITLYSITCTNSLPSSLLWTSVGVALQYHFVHSSTLVTLQYNITLS